MKTDFTNSFILNALNLPIIKDLDDLSYQIGIGRRLIYLLSKDNNSYYSNFCIKKRNGNNRIIDKPAYSLRLVQRWILKEILERIDVTKESMAFINNMNGCKENALIHKHNLYILQLDIEDFFRNISEDKVYFLFRNLGYNSFISKTLTNLCVYKGYLPQGGVCSPYLSNLVCYKLDKRITGFCSKRDITYTRYADDLTFSCNNKIVLKKIKAIIIEIIEDEGFNINQQKTRFSSPASNKVVNGIGINNNELKANRKLKKLIRSMIYRAISTGDYSDKFKILGYISYVNSIEDNYLETIKKYMNNLVKKFNAVDQFITSSFNTNKFFYDLEEMQYPYDPTSEF